MDQALALNLRKPQDYFRRVWSTGFRAADLADTANTVHQQQPHGAVTAITMFSSSFSTAGPDAVSRG